MKIFAHLSARTLGDFAAYALLASSIRELFDDAALYVYFHNDRPYKKAIASCIHNATRVFPVPATSNSTLPIEFFDYMYGRHRLPGSPLEEEPVSDADLILSGRMLTDAMLYSIPITTLRPPSYIAGSSNDALVALGLDPSKWIATVYWKEKGYPFRRDNPLRMIDDPAPYIAAIRHIIENLGGQVVRLGHPSPTELPKLPGLIDLAKVEASEWLQLYAVSVSRFLMAHQSGPASYGSSLGVPTALTEVHVCQGAWRDHDYMVTWDIIADGKALRQTELFDAGYLRTDWEPQQVLKFRHNTAAQLIAGADEMFQSTRDCTGWRPPAAPVALQTRPNAISLPIPQGHRRDLLIPPSRRALKPGN